MGDETKTGGLALVSDLESFTGKGLTELKGTPLKKNFLWKILVSIGILIQLLLLQIRTTRRLEEHWISYEFLETKAKLNCISHVCSTLCILAWCAFNRWHINSSQQKNSINRWIHCCSLIPRYAEGTDHSLETLTGIAGRGARTRTRLLINLLQTSTL